MSCWNENVPIKDAHFSVSSVITLGLHLRTILAREFQSLAVLLS